MAEDPSQSRTEAASARRRREARQKGDVPFSAELASALALLASMSVLLVIGPWIWMQLAQLLRFQLGQLSLTNLDITMSVAMSQSCLGFVLRTAGPVLCVAFITSVVTGLFQTGQNLSWEPLRPQLDRIQPQKGLSRMFHPRTLIRTLVVFLKMLMLSALMGWQCMGHFRTWFGTPLRSYEMLMVNMGSVLAVLSWTVLIAFLAVALVDFAYQRWQYEQKLMMSRQELKEERKEEEGDSQIRSMRRRRQRDFLRQQIERDVPTALAVVVNPTHFAVAIRYEQGKMSAPQVVAKGQDRVAQRIIEVARRHRVPIVRKPELARTLFRTVKVGKQVPSHLFRAVAEIIAHIYRSRGKAPLHRGSSDRAA